MVWVNGALTPLPEGEADEAALDQEVSFALAGEHQWLQVRGDV